MTTMILPTEQDTTPEVIVTRVADILLAQGEGLLNDEGVDGEVAYDLAQEIADDVVGHITCGICSNWKLPNITVCVECKCSPASQSTYDERDLCEDCFVAECNDY